VREIDDLPATVWWGVQVRQPSLHTCTVQCTRAGNLCSSDIGCSWVDLRVLVMIDYLVVSSVLRMSWRCAETDQLSSSAYCGCRVAVGVWNVY
jgi:hypothetical protein